MITTEGNVLNELRSYIPALVLPFFILIAHLLRSDLESLGLFFPLIPRSLEGLPGILGWIFYHGDSKHLWGNMSSLLVLGVFLRSFSPNKAFSRLIGIWLLAGFWTWLIARPTYHIGASGIVYGYLSYLLYAAWSVRSRRYMALSFVLIFLYGSAVWGIFPVQEGVSWEGHLCGASAGLFMAWMHRKEWIRIRAIEKPALSEEPFADDESDAVDPYREMRNKEEDWGDNPERWQ